MGVESVSDFFAYWLRQHDKSAPKTLRERFWLSCRGTGVKWAPFTGLLVMTLSGLDTIMTRTSLLDAGPGIRFLFGMYACTTAVYFNAFKQEETLAMLRQLSWVAVQVEGGELGGQPDPDTQAMLRRTATSSSRFIRGGEIWSCFVMISIGLPVALTGKPANPTWPPPDTPAQWWSLLVLHCLSTVFLPAAYFSLFPLITSLFRQCSALEHAIAKLLERAHTFQQVRDATLLSSELNHGFAMLNGLFHGILSHILQSTLFIPLFAAYEMLNGQFDGFLIAVIPLNFAFFLPLCLAGEGTKSAALAEAAYNGSWLEGDHNCRVLRLQVMQRAARPNQITSREMGPINLRLFQEALKSWFSFLNFMLNTL
ncbi:Odorant receptor 36 [Frankliniella occidentalis]|uniref:Uncharacterized protein LOC127751741 n=1 Tax=Frankliniella occidentalis TaxID=133901 RepID=A0A9C6X9N6_FRAOC|nr:uncharacterized protein LOC127751741 [Frankliniella occidentalis]KAE8737591.1 Odorant receptor 36 [Frankliniella occidentalis]